jgi:hypothetical protein
VKKLKNSIEGADFNIENGMDLMIQHMVSIWIPNQDAPYFSSDQLQDHRFPDVPSLSEVQGYTEWKS